MATTKKTRTSGQRTKKPSGIIRVGENYTLGEFMSTLGCNWHSLREMRRKGLVVRQDSTRRLMVRGEDYDNYLKTLPVADVSPSPESHSATPGSDQSESTGRCETDRQRATDGL